ncbi:hypothetical protein R3W88_034222 [Solanum pinnatisectum]|uniref:RNase H type-1 domain-containing protein n=1 Tax=Solanum pinnatisectum TaxID=50273 RepID=A0AAV9K0S3_9SOLN|nr:hypothetical protein R3W88_034222 [Solanum pinnatisectum]
MIQQLIQIIQYTIKRRFHWIKIQGKEWKDIVKILGDYKPRLYHHVVNWELPREGEINCNMDGACKGNPGVGAYGFCLRNNTGDIIYAEA